MPFAKLSDQIAQGWQSTSSKAPSYANWKLRPTDQATHLLGKNKGKSSQQKCLNHQNPKNFVSNGIIVENLLCLNVYISGLSMGWTWLGGNDNVSSANNVSLIVFAFSAISLRTILNNLHIFLSSSFPFLDVCILLPYLLLLLYNCPLTILLPNILPLLHVNCSSCSYVCSYGIRLKWDLSVKIDLAPK